MSFFGCVDGTGAAETSGSLTLRDQSSAVVFALLGAAGVSVDAAAGLMSVAFAFVELAAAVDSGFIAGRVAGRATTPLCCPGSEGRAVLAVGTVLDGDWLDGTLWPCTNLPFGI